MVKLRDGPREEVLNCTQHALSPWEELAWTIWVYSTHTEKAMSHLLAEKVAAA